MAAGSPYLRTSYQARLWAMITPLGTPFRRRVALVGLLLAVIMPMALGQYYISLLNLALIAAISVLGLNVITGYAGQVNLGHAGFMLAGQLVSGAIWLHIGPQWANFWVVAPASVVTGAVLGVLFAWPASRVRGIYVALTTLALYQVVYAGALRYFEYLQQTFKTGTELKLGRLDLLVGTVDGTVSWYYFLLGLFLACLTATNFLVRSKAGRAWLGIRVHETMTACSGVNVTLYKVWAFAVGGGLGALAGMLFAFYHHSVSPDAFPLEVNFEYLAMVLVGGPGSILGGVLGAFFIVLVPYLIQELLRLAGAPPTLAVQLTAIKLGLFAMLTLVFIVWEPDGLAGIWVRIRQYFELWPFRQRPLEVTRR